MKGRNIIAGFIVLSVVYAILFNPRGREYSREVDEEIKIAMRICENSQDYVMNNRERLKLSNNKLDDIPVEGVIPRLRHVRTPEVILLHSGYRHANARQAFFCTFNDPRGKAADSSSGYYYDYTQRAWVDTALNRR